MTRRDPEAGAGAPATAEAPAAPRRARIRLLGASHGAKAGAVVETTPEKADRLVGRGLARHVK